MPALLVSLGKFEMAALFAVALPIACLVLPVIKTFCKTTIWFPFYVLGQLALGVGCGMYIFYSESRVYAWVYAVILFTVFLLVHKKMCHHVKYE